jgi:glycosyltransferase involved in cell wall biosynthesis
VLAQGYARFEYILSDNCSTDGSTEIAEAYALRNPRIRLIKQPRLLSQVAHYNCALAEISDASEYCKMVQADDFIFPDCLKLMVKAFEQSESIGLVSAYDLKRNTVRGSGFPFPQSFMSGKELARLYLRWGLFVFGSPTTVMYRSSLVRNCRPFYDETLLHEDTEKCMQILGCWDFGFVHQILSFLRTGNESISAGAFSFRPDALDRYIIVQRYSSSFLEPSEAEILRKNARRDYYRVLAHQALKLPGEAFWGYHEQGLSTLGEAVNWPYLLLQIGRDLLSKAMNPGLTLSRALSLAKCKVREKWESRS